MTIENIRLAFFPYFSSFFFLLTTNTVHRIYLLDDLRDMQLPVVHNNILQTRNHIVLSELFVYVCVSVCFFLTAIR